MRPLLLQLALQRSARNDPNNAPLWTHYLEKYLLTKKFLKRPRAIAKQLFLVNTRKKSNEKTKKSNEKTNNSDKFKRPLPDLYLRPSLRISTAGTSKFPQNSKFQSEARFGFSAKKAAHSDGNRPKIRSICHVTNIKPDSASPRCSV